MLRKKCDTAMLVASKKASNMRLALFRGALYIEFSAAEFQVYRRTIHKTTEADIGGGWRKLLWGYYFAGGLYKSDLIFDGDLRFNCDRRVYRLA